MAAGDYRFAAIAWEQRFFEAAATMEKVAARLHKVSCLKQCGLFHEALESLDQLPLFGLDDSLRAEVFYQKAFCAYLDGRFEDAAFYMEELKYSLPLYGSRPRTTLLYALTCNETGMYAKARFAASEFLDSLHFSHDSEEYIQLQRLYAPSALPIILKPGKAGMMSTFIPGLGQMFSGRAGEGAVSFLFNAGSLTLGTIAVLNGYYFSGYLIGAGLFQRFYFGGIKRSQFLAEKRNYELSRKFNDSVRSWLISIGQGH
jgi:tetratricopeptide (TPR) repeat protein